MSVNTGELARVPVTVTATPDMFAHPLGAMVAALQTGHDKVQVEVYVTPDHQPPTSYTPEHGSN